jgi:glutamyl-tRNA reductase
MAIRSEFSLSENQSLLVLQRAAEQGLTGCIVLSTCNRTEIYGMCVDPQIVVELFCDQTQTQVNYFQKYGYVYQGYAAVEHLFKVASGLDSQIIGDYEILGQLKQSVQFSRINGCLNSSMERIINYSLQASKEVKTKTKLSTGTVSVSYAAIEIIKEKILDIPHKKFLLVGTGKFGKNVAKNLKSYLPEPKISFINRTDEKAWALSNLYDADFIPYKNLSSACNDADIILVSSSAESYCILPSFFIDDKPRLILDLSVPQNVDPSVKDLQEITLLDVDEVSSISDKTIAMRQAELPAALQIIKNTLDEMMLWRQSQTNNSLLRITKSQLYQLSKHCIGCNEERIHKTVSTLAIELKNKTNKGCQCIHALNHFLQTT